MIRACRKLSNRPRAVSIWSGLFTFRTLHATPERGPVMPAEGTLDKLIPLTMPAVRGERHRFPAPHEIVL